MNIRVGYSQTGETVQNFVWTQKFHDPPKNIEIPELQSGETGELRLERLLPARSTVSHADSELWVDGSVLLQFGFTLRGKQMALSSHTYSLPDTSLQLTGESKNSQLEATQDIRQLSDEKT